MCSVRNRERITGGRRLARPSLIAVVADDPIRREQYLDFHHPCGVPYSLVAVDDDSRKPHSQGPVPAELMIRGTYAVCVSLRDAEWMEEFMQMGWGGRRTSDQGNRIRYEVGAGGPGAIVDFEVEPERKAGSWIVGEGAVHHMAFQVENHEQQDQLCCDKKKRKKPSKKRGRKKIPITTNS